MYVYVENGRGQGTVDTLTPCLSNLCEKKVFVFTFTTYTTFTFSLFIGAGGGERRGECSVGRNAFDKNQNGGLWHTLHAALPNDTLVVGWRDSSQLKMKADP